MLLLSLSSKLKSRNLSIFKQGIRELEKAGQRSIAEVIDLLDDDDAYKRRSAVEVAAKLRDEKITAKLLELLWDRDEGVRDSVREVLIKTSSSDFTKMISESDKWLKDISDEIVFVKKLELDDQLWVAQGLLLSPITARVHHTVSPSWVYWKIGETSIPVSCCLRPIHYIGSGITADGRRMTVVNGREYTRNDLNVLRLRIENTVRFCIVDPPAELLDNSFFLGTDSSSEAIEYQLLINLFFDKWNYSPDVYASISFSVSLFSESMSSTSDKNRLIAATNYFTSSESVARSSSPKPGDYFPIEVSGKAKVRGVILLEDLRGENLYECRMYLSSSDNSVQAGDILSREVNWWEKNKRKHFRADMGRIIDIISIKRMP